MLWKHCVGKEKLTNMDFIATIITPWHLLGVKAYLLKLREDKRRKISGIIIIEAHPRNGTLIRDNMLQFPEDIECVRLDSKDNLDNYLSCLDSEVLHILSPNFPDIMLCHRIKKQYSVLTKAVVVDEGVGCYDKSVARWFKSIYIDSHNIFTPMKFFTRRIYENVLQIMDNIEVSYFTLFSYVGNQLVKNQDICKYYAKAIDYSAKDLTFDLNRPYVLLFTNPLEEEGHVSGNDLRSGYLKLDSIFNAYGFDMYIRPHPRETNLSKYNGLKLLTVETESSETLLAGLKTKPAFVLGAHSTSLVTAKIFWNINSITICKIIKAKCKTQYCRDLISKYELNFSNIVEFPTDFEELENIVKEGM